MRAHPGARAFGLALLAALVPACGDSSDGPGSAPSVAVFAVAGTQSEVVAIRYSLTDLDRDPVDVVAEFSDDGGATWAPATRAVGGESLAGQSSSPAGMPHVFLWDSEIDRVAVGTRHATTPTPGTVNPAVRVRLTPSDVLTGPPGETPDFAVDNTFERPIGTATGLFPFSLPLQVSGETELGNLVADSMRVRTGCQLALQNGAGIQDGVTSVFQPADLSLRRPDAGYAAGPPYDLVAGDALQALPFGDRVVSRTVTGALLRQILEHGVATNTGNRFPHISGFSFTFSLGAPAGSKVLSVTRDGGAPIPADGAVYTFATNDFLSGGGDGYAMLNDGQAVVVWERQERILADHIRASSPVVPALTGRVTSVP